MSRGIKSRSSPLLIRPFWGILSLLPPPPRPGPAGLPVSGPGPASHVGFLCLELPPAPTRLSPRHLFGLGRAVCSSEKRPRPRLHPSRARVCLPTTSREPRPLGTWPRAERSAISVACFSPPSTPGRGGRCSLRRTVRQERSAPGGRPCVFSVILMVTTSSLPDSVVRLCGSPDVLLQPEKSPHPQGMLGACGVAG